MPHPLTHGIDTYFGEFSANRRRVASVLLAVSAVLAAVLGFAGRRIATSLMEGPKRFGFEGPTEWVERIRLEEMAAHDTPGMYTVTYLTAESRKGGRKAKRSVPNSEPQPEVRQEIGLGEDAQDILARARMLALQGPVIRSEELIIERLVRPEYPEEARDKNLEGVVELVALIDTTGSVLQVEILPGAVDPMFEHAAAKAILQCRYRPYRVNDKTRPVRAKFRIAFSFY